MKLFFAALLMLLEWQVSAQNILVPFKTDGKYGLVDANGKVIVHPAYDELKWQAGQYFTSANKITTVDTVKTASGERRIIPQKIIRTGIFFKDKEIIKNSSYSRFEIIPDKFIIGENDNRIYNPTKEEFAKTSAKGKFVSLFTTAGKNVFPEDFKRIQKFDTAGISLKNNGKAKYVLFGAEHIDYTNSLFVFDMDKQEISAWLVRHAKKIVVKDARYPNKMVRFEIADENNVVTSKIVDYRSGQFILTADPAQTKTSIKNDDTELRYSGTSGSSGNYMTDDSYAPTNMRRDASGTVTKQSEITYLQNFITKGDSLFWNISSTEKILVNVPAGATLLFAEERAKSQQLPLIFKQNKQFGWLYAGNMSQQLYDSLVYFGNGFIAGKITAGKMQYYFLDRSGAASGSEWYDSIQTKMKQFQSAEEHKPDAKRLWVLKEKREYSSYNKDPKNNYKLESSDKIIVYKNGKAGLINALQQIIIPIQYDLIADNGLSFQRPNSSNFVLLKKNNLYGLTELRHNKDLKKYEMSNTIEPVFEQFPAFITNNYYGIRGLRLVGLYDEDIEFAGYGSEKGGLYNARSSKH